MRKDQAGEIIYSDGGVGGQINGIQSYQLGELTIYRDHSSTATKKERAFIITVR